MVVVGESIGDKRKREHLDPTPPSSNVGDVGSRVDGGNTDDEITGDEWADTAAVLPKTKPADAVQPSAAVVAPPVQKCFAHEALRRLLMSQNEKQAASRKVKAETKNRVRPY